MSPILPEISTKPRFERLKEMSAQDTPAISVSRALATVGSEMPKIRDDVPAIKFPSIVLQSSK
jgi:hypothetical protein